MNDVKLSNHFWLSELTVSNEAARQGIDNTPEQKIIDRLTYLASQLDLIRDSIGVPLIVLSGFRCVTLNTKIGGAKRSWHIEGQAADLIAPKFGTPLELATHIKKLRDGGVLRAHEIIHEFGKWAHIAVPLVDEKPGNELLTYDVVGGKTRCRSGLLAIA